MQRGRETSSSLLTLNIRRFFFLKKSFAIILAIFIAYIKHNTGWFPPEKITTELLRWTDSYWRPWPAWWGVSTGNWKQEKYRASHRASSDIRAQGTGILICPKVPCCRGTWVLSSASICPHLFFQTKLSGKGAEMLICFLCFRWNLLGKPFSAGARAVCLKRIKYL